MKIELAHVFILGLAVYRLTRLIIQDQVFDRARKAVWNKFGPKDGIGYLITCYWCTSFWVSSLVVLCYTIVPIPTTAVAFVLALSAITGIIAAWLDK